MTSTRACFAAALLTKQKCFVTFALGRGGGEGEQRRQQEEAGVNVIKLFCFVIDA